MNLKLDIEWLLKALACVILVLAGFGKVFAAIIGFNEGTGIFGSLCLGLGVYLAAPLVGGLLKKPTP